MSAPHGWASGDNLAESCQADPPAALLFALEKFIKANKQLLSVARAVNRKPLSEALAQQLEQAYTSLMETTNEMAEDRKAAQTTTNEEYVKKLVNRTSTVSVSSSNLCKLCGALATDTQQVTLYKSLGLAATTLRDSLLRMVDTLMEVPDTWQDALAEALYYGSVKTVEKSLSLLLTAKAKALGDNVIPRGEVAEVTATCCASVAALTRVLYLFEERSGKGVRPLELVSRIKVAAVAISQLGASMSVAIAKSDLGISHGIMKESILAAAEDVKQVFLADTLPICREVLCSDLNDPEMVSAIETAVSAPRDAAATLLSFVINLSEVNISEVKNLACKPQTGDVEAAQKILQTALPERPAQRNPNEASKDVLDGGDVWEEGPDTEENTTFGTVQPNPEVRLKAASFNKIIEKMTSADPERDMLRKTFVMMHPSITTHAAFFDKLMQRFEVPPERAIEKTTVQRYVCQCVQEWMEKSFDDLSDDLLERVEEWAESLKVDVSLRGLGKILATQLQNKRFEREQEEVMGQEVNVDALDGSLLDAVYCINPSKVLEKFSEEDIAKQLTLTDFSIYVNIRPSELLDQAWNKAKYKYRAVNVSRLIRRATDTTLWVCSLLLWPKTLRERVRVLGKIIEIAQVLRRLNNFHALVSFMSALNLSAIHRLKHTFEALPEDTARVLEELRELTSVSKHHKNYRAALAAVEGPAIPFLGISLTDVTMLDDGNASFARDLINVYKFDKLHSVISEVLCFQQSPYLDITPNEQLSLLLTELPHNHEEDLFKLSLLREPRNGVVV